MVDIFVLLMAHTVAPSRKKKLETLLRAKVRVGLFSEELLKETFSAHTQVNRGFPALLHSPPHHHSLLATQYEA